MKVNWGTAVVIAMITFIVFILTFVYRSAVMDEYQHELVSEDYYKDELHYQEEIDKVNNASKLDVNLTLIRTSDGLTLRFPEGMQPSSISGSIYLQRPSNKSLDLRIPFELTELDLLIPDKDLASGKYLVVVDWKHENSEYMFKDEIFY
ncbi:MAG: FixH family protein [Lutimonas sp.]